MKKKVVTSVTLDLEQYLKLLNLKERRIIENVSEVIRKALDEYLKKLDKDIKERGANG